MANRYTRLTPSRYNPRTMQEMMLLPMMQRKQHDQSLAQAAEMELFKQKSAGVDKETVDRVKGEFKGSIDEYVETLNKNGFNSETTQGLLDLSKSRRKLEEDYLNPAQANLQAMQEHRKQVMESEDWSPELAQRYAQEQLSGFKGTFNEDGSTNSFNGKLLPKHVDVNKRLDDAIKTIGNDVVQGGLVQYGIHNYTDLMASNKIDKLDKDRILQSVGLQIQGDTEFINSYKTESRLNGLNEFDGNGQLKIGSYNDKGQFAPESQFGLMLYGKAAGAASTKQTLSLSNIKDDLGLHKAKADLESAKSGDIPYASLPDERFPLYEKDLRSSINKLGQALNVDRPVNIGYKSQEDFLRATEDWRQDQENGGRVFSVNMMSEDTKKQYTSIFTKLGESGIIPTGMDINSPEAGKAVNAYLDKYKDASHKNVIIQANASGLTANDTSLMLGSKEQNGASNFLSNNIKAGITKVWDEQGNVVELDDDFWKLGDIEYLGYVSPNNYIDQLGTSGPKEAVMPHMFLGPDRKRYYASRQDSETEKPTFKAGSLIKNATFEGARQPELDVEHSVDPILSRAGVDRIVTKYNPLTKAYSLLIEKDGEVFFKSKEGEELTTERFNNTIYELYK